MRHSLFLLAAAGLLLFACGNEATSDDDDDGSGTSSSSSSGAVSQADAGGGFQIGTLDFSVDGKSTLLDLTQLATTTFKDTTVIELPTLWDALGTGTSYDGSTFDFVGADGFRPASRDKCKTVVFDGATFAKGYVEVDSQRLTWDDDLGFSGCAFVSDLTSIEATTK